MCGELAPNRIEVNAVNYKGEDSNIITRKALDARQYLLFSIKHRIMVIVFEFAMRLHIHTSMAEHSRQKAILIFEQRSQKQAQFHVIYLKANIESIFYFIKLIENAPVSIKTKPETRHADRHRTVPRYGAKRDNVFALVSATHHPLRECRKQNHVENDMSLHWVAVMLPFPTTN